jgi:quercetin dioxygenase-like cupin family protein
VGEEPQRVPLGAMDPVTHDIGVDDREHDVSGVRWALVTYSPRAGRADWCDVPHVGYVLDGGIRYEFEDERPSLDLRSGDGFVLPSEPRHRGANPNDLPARLFLIDTAL